LALLELGLAERGLEAAAADIARRRVETKQESRAAVLNDMGMVRARQGKLDEAVARLAEALALEPDFMAALVNMATALQQTERVAEAIPYYEQALRIDPRNVTAIFNLALARCQLGRADQTRAELEQLDVLDPATAAKLRAVLQRLSEPGANDVRR
jgi:tetratricopeptide (TPR) repeat protein